MLQRLSTGLARLEEMTAALLAAAVTCLILANVAMRAAGHPLYFVSELAIYAMIWMTFLIASAVLKRRQGIAVTLLSDVLPLTGRRMIGLWVDVIVASFGIAMLVLCWRWFQPLSLWQSGFDISTFQGNTFNFIYSENTTTLGIKKLWFWLILPWFALSITLHGVANLIDTLTHWRHPLTDQPTETPP
ncbi:TRAP transporter small permease [Halomonas sp. LS-001]